MTVLTRIREYYRYPHLPDTFSTEPSCSAPFPRSEGRGVGQRPTITAR